MGTAFGLMGSLESIVLAGFPLVAASIVSSSVNTEAGYSKVGYFFAGTSNWLNVIFLGSLGLLLSVSLYFFDN